MLHSDEVHYSNGGATCTAGFIAKELQELEVPGLEELKTMEEVATEYPEVVSILPEIEAVETELLSD